MKVEVPTVGGASRRYFSLKVVCRVTPLDDQRRQAQIALRRWGERRGVDGICDTVVVPEREGIYADFLGMEAA